ncbi:MAG: glycosyltransferase [Polyangiales bacterium]
MILHVACLPFPSHQGTQAALDAMLQASVGAGQPTHLLAYASGAYRIDAPYEVHRIPDFPKVRSLRSGPSWGKIALDARCVFETRRLVRRLRPAAIVAHHVEAAVAVLAAGVTPAFYVAHTCLRHELPAYFPSLPAHLVGEAANRVERTVCARVAGVAAVAPSLCRLLGGHARYLPVPWAISTPPDRCTREAARCALGLSRSAQICLYAGNLDPYQGWEHLIEALLPLRRTHPKARLLIATESDPSPARSLATRLGVAGSVDFCRLDGERARKLAHASADLAWVPRRTEGGLPIKMLDSFARAVPVVAMRRATAGLPMRDACIAVRNDDAEALAAGVRQLLDDGKAAAALQEAACRYLALHHRDEAFVNALRDLVGDTGPTTPATRYERHPAVERVPRAL